MKYKIITVCILCLFTQFNKAQKVTTLEEYQAVVDSIIPLVTCAVQDTNLYKGKPLSEFVKRLKQCNAEIVIAWFSETDNKVYKEHVYGIRLMFTTQEFMDFSIMYLLSQPSIFIRFEGSKPWNEASELHRKCQNYFTKEVEEFYSDAIIQSIKIFIPDDIIAPHMRDQGKK